MIKKIVSASDDCTLRIWDIGKMECEQVFKNNFKGVVSILDLPSKMLFITGSKDRTIKIYSYVNAESIRCIKSINAHDMNILALAYNFDYDVLISSGLDKYLKCFDIYSGTVKLSFKNECSIYCLEILNKKSFAAGCHDPGIEIFSMDFKIIKVLRGHTHSVFSLLYLKKMKVLVSGSLDTTVIIWDVKKGTPLRELRGHFRSILNLINFEDKDLIGSFGYEAEIHIWDYKKAKKSQTIPVTNYQRNSTYSFVYHYYASFVYVEEEKKFFFSYFDDDIKVRDSKIIKKDENNYEMIDER